MNGILRFCVFLVLTPFTALLPLDACAEIEWLETFCNFGSIKEDDGAVKGKARFVNRGKNPTFIASVRPSCGCTDVTYTEETVQPGDTATIEFVFDPTGRPGKFEKTIRVTIGKENSLCTIKLYGTVIASGQTLKSTFPVEAGVLRLDRKSILAGDIGKGATRHFFINAYNSGTDTVIPAWESMSPAVVTDLTPRILPPGETASLSFTVKGHEAETTGPEKLKIRIKPSAASEDEAVVEISANFIPDISGFTASQLDSLPYAMVYPEVVDLGSVKQSKHIPFSFEIINQGKGKLSVSKISPESESVIFPRFPSAIKGERKTRIKGILNPEHISPGPFRINVNITTDDPLHPVRTIRVVGIIEQK